jgi:hypothetical protein
MRAAYPIHPEIFDRLYGDWSTLVKFQRTRGVLRLMAAVIHSLWEKGDKNPLILPAHIAIDDNRVQFELTRYLSDNWAPVIEKDVDGANSLPLRLDGELPNLGKFSACRRVARTIYLGSAPLGNAAHRGIEDRRVKLGSVLPGEAPAVFGDALRRLAAAATYLYQDGPYYWYSTQPTVTKLAEDRAEQLRRDPDKVAMELEKRLRKDLERKGDFGRIHPLPQGAQDVPDDLDTRLVVLGPQAPYSKEGQSAAELSARGILEKKGSAPRLHRNTLVFLAADKTRLQDLDEAARKYLAWESILLERNELDLTPQQVKQAEIQKGAAEGAVTARLPETYQWLLVPQQEKPSDPLTYGALRLSGSDPLAVRVGKKLRNDELLITGFAASRLRMELDRVPLWRGEHVAVGQLLSDFAQYVYLPRLRDPRVLLEAIESGVGLLTWMQDSFAYAESYDEALGRYRGLRGGQHIVLREEDKGLLVRPEVAQRQMEAEAAQAQAARAAAAGAGQAATRTGGMPEPQDGSANGGHVFGAEAEGVPAAPAIKVGPKRYHGAVTLDAQRVGRDASRVAEEVLAHLVGLPGAKVRVTLEIEVEIPQGAPENVVRVVTENGRALKFGDSGFERE